MDDGAGDDQSLIEAVYQTVARPESWSAFLTQFRRALDLKCVTVLSPPAVSQSEAFSLYAHDDTFDVQEANDFLAEFGAGDPVSRPMLARIAGRWDQVVTARESMNWAELDQAPAWKAYFQRMGVSDVAALILHEPNGPWPTFSSASALKDEEISRSQKIRLQRLAPHLRRAARLRYRLGPDLGIDAHYLAAIDGMASGCILLDEAGVIMHANPAAARIFEANGPLRARWGRLSATDPSQDAVLQEVTRRACRIGARQGGEVTIATSGVHPLVAMVVPLGGDNPLTERISAARAAVYLLTEPESCDADIAERRLAAIYGLTAAEAEVARLLTEGQSPEEIATSRSRSVLTVRVQVKSILGKAGFRRIGDLQARSRLLTPLRPN